MQAAATVDPTPVAPLQWKPTEVSREPWTTDVDDASDQPDNTMLYTGDAVTQSQLLMAINVTTTAATFDVKLEEEEDEQLIAATTDIAVDTTVARIEPLAEPHTQTAQDAWDLENSTFDESPPQQQPYTDPPTVSTTAATQLTSLAQPRHWHADGTREREAKTIGAPASGLDDDADSDDQLDDSVAPFAAELTFNKQQRDKALEADEYDEPAATALKSRSEFTDDTAVRVEETDEETAEFGPRISFARSSDATTKTPAVTTETPTAAAVVTLTATTGVYASTSTSRLAPTAPTAYMPKNARTPQSTTSTSTTMTTTTTTTTTAATKPAMPRGVPNVETTIGVDEILRRHVYESHVRSPMAVLVDATPDVLRKTRVLWMASLKPQPNLDVILMTFNMSGKSSVGSVRFVVCVAASTRDLSVVWWECCGATPLL